MWQFVKVNEQPNYPIYLQRFTINRRGLQVIWDTHSHLLWSLPPHLFGFYWKEEFLREYAALREDALAPNADMDMKA